MVYDMKTPTSVTDHMSATKLGKYVNDGYTSVNARSASFKAKVPKASSHHKQIHITSSCQEASSSHKKFPPAISRMAVCSRMAPAMNAVPSPGPFSLTTFSAKRLDATLSFTRYTLVVIPEPGILRKPRSSSFMVRVNDGTLEAPLMNLTSSATRFYPAGEMAWEMIRSHKFEVDRARVYAAEILLGLETLHTRLIIHRDVKRGNLLWTDTGRMFRLSKVFNICASAEDISFISFDAGNSSESGFFVPPTETLLTNTTESWTPYYMTPEMHRGDDYSFEVGFWALGVTVYQMVTGRVSIIRVGRLRDGDGFARDGRREKRLQEPLQ